MPGRKYEVGNGYRYGFNGKENDNEVKGEGEQQDYGMRIYDPRLGRFLSVDPLRKRYAWYTPYQFAGDKPIKYVDIDGAEEGEGEGEVGDEDIKEKQERWEAELKAEEEAARLRSEKDELKRRDLYSNNPVYRTLANANTGIQVESYWRSAFNAANFVLGGSTVRDNNTLGNVWDDLVKETMLKNPNYIGIGRQVSFKVVGMVNGEQMVAKIRLDNVGIKRNEVTGEPIFDLTEAKYSIEEITEGNVQRTLTPQQKQASFILVNGTHVQIYVRGEASAGRLSTPETGIIKNGQNITGLIGEIKIVVPGNGASVGDNIDKVGATKTNSDNGQPNSEKKQ